MATTAPRTVPPQVRSRNNWSLLYRLEIGEGFLTDASRGAIYSALRRCRVKSGRAFDVRPGPRGACRVVRVEPKAQIQMPTLDEDLAGLVDRVARERAMPIEKARVFLAAKILSQPL